MFNAFCYSFNSSPVCINSGAASGVPSELKNEGTRCRYLPFGVPRTQNIRLRRLHSPEVSPEELKIIDERLNSVVGCISIAMVYTLAITNLLPNKKKKIFRTIHKYT